MEAKAQDRIPDFEAFWPYYVGEHAKKLTRTLHFVGTAAAATTLATAILTRKPALVLGALVAGYGPAWVSHFFIEKNRPATFTYPLWSLLADFKMWGMTASGTMDAEVERVLREREASVEARENGASSHEASSVDEAVAAATRKVASGALN